MENSIAEEKLRSLLKYNPLLIWHNSFDSLMIVDSSLKEIYYNSSLHRLINSVAPKNTSIETFLMDMCIFLGVESIFQNDKPKYNVKVKEDGLVLIANIIPLSDYYCMVIFQNITKLEIYEKKIDMIEEVNKELNDIIELSADGLVTVDANGITLRMNKAYEEIVGVNAKDFVGKPVTLLKEQGYLPDLVSIHVLSDFKPKNLYHVIRGKDVLLTGRPVFSSNGKLIRVVANIRDLSELNKLKEELNSYKELTERYELELQCFRAKNSDSGMVFSSPVMRNTVEFALRVAQVDSNVLIYGESGTGKEVIARLIHQHGRNGKGPFIGINCGAIPVNLLESELFGYESGAFTGASKSGRVGLLEASANGTLFLDEVSEIPLELQVKLLRVIEERTFRPIGSNKEKVLRSHIVAATNRDLQKMVEEGKFRKDLFYRLNVIQINVPPLRERREDIPLLINYFLKKISLKYGMRKEISERAVAKLMNYDWPGNVRELENMIERLVVFSQGTLLEPDLINKSFLGNTDKEIALNLCGTLKQILEETEKRIILNTYKECGSTRKTALRLGVSQPTIVRKLRTYTT